MKKFWAAILVSLWAGLAALPAEAVEASAVDGPVKVDLITRYNQINPKSPLEVILKFNIAEGWHIFSDTPGEIALPTTVNWTMPQNYKLKKYRWSLGEDFVTDDIVQNGFQNTAYYMAKIRPNRKLIKGQAALEAEVNWLACKEECIPGSAVLAFELPISHGDALQASGWERVLQNAELSFVSNSITQNASFILILLMAFVGGLILNFMPCIFPILTIKVISLAHNAYHKKISQAKAGMYVLGVFVSFMIVATILYILRLQGEEIGWGFQLQSPVFVGIMIVIFFVIFLMLLDIININIALFGKMARVSVKGALWNSFLTGLLSVLIASPCTAPFMGIAIGYTLTAPVYIYYPIFISLSLGYALPFALAELFPKAIRRILPKPGRWMDILKKIFAIPVLLTCVWLGWILYNQMHVHLGDDTQNLNWQEYDAVKVSRLVSENKPVFIDFTAKWCLTCLLNKRIALQSDEFAEFVKEKNVTLFRADWTNRDAKIASALEFYGRNSIPLYVYYNGDGPGYVLLPQLLTTGIISQYLR